MNMEVCAEENPPQPASDSSLEEKAVPPSDNENLPAAAAAELSETNGGVGSGHKLSGEEVRDALQAIASTGKFWHDWDDLKSMLSFQLKQVLSEYPEAKVGDDPEKSSIRQAYLNLVRRLDEELNSFREGPPFTLQRICEILLDAQGIYPVLSKLELALEKNLLVTTTLSKGATQEVVEHPNEITEVDSRDVNRPHSSPVENGEEVPSSGDRDEIMTEAVEEASVQDDMNTDIGSSEVMAGSEEKELEPISTNPAPPSPTNTTTANAAPVSPTYTTTANAAPVSPTNTTANAAPVSPTNTATTNDNSNMDACS